MITLSAIFNQRSCLQECETVVLIQFLISIVDLLNAENDAERCKVLPN